MTGPGRRFDPSELHDADGAPLSDAESAAMLSTARDLEAFARAESIAPTSGFEDRVMTAIAAEPPPRAVATGGWIAGFAVVLRDAWRITWSGGGGRPLAVRAQAFALVLLVVVAFGSLGTVAAVGVSRILTGDPTTPPITAPSVDPLIPRPTSSFPTPSIAPSPPPSTSPSPSAGESDEPGESSEPSESPEGTDDSGGTPRPSASPRPTSDPTDTPEPTDDDDDGTPEPTDDDDDETPKPSETPEPTDEDDSSGSGSGSNDD
jgi:hypothetical protein